MPVRNSSVARFASTAAGSTVIYTVPASNVLLLKSVEIYHWGSVSGPAYIGTNTSEGQTVHPAEFAPLTAGTAAHWSGWVPINAGDQVVAHVPDANVHVMVGGALLPYNASL